MNPYRDLDDAYQRLARRPARRTILTRQGADLDAIVATIRDDKPDSGQSDHALRSMIATGRTNPDAVTVVLYALAPELRARVSRTATDEYHAGCSATSPSSSSTATSTGPVSATGSSTEPTTASGVAPGASTPAVPSTSRPPPPAHPTGSHASTTTGPASPLMSPTPLPAGSISHGSALRSRPRWPTD